MLSVVMLNVAMLSVVGPFSHANSWLNQYLAKADYSQNFSGDCHLPKLHLAIRHSTKYNERRKSW
jgi:hypothetical protein